MFSNGSLYPSQKNNPKVRTVTKGMFDTEMTEDYLLRYCSTTCWTRLVSWNGKTGDSNQSVPPCTGFEQVSRDLTSTISFLTKIESNVRKSLRSDVGGQKDEDRSKYHLLLLWVYISLYLFYLSVLLHVQVPTSVTTPVRHEEFLTETLGYLRGKRLV